MNRQPIVVFPDSYPAALNVVGERITVLASRHDTGAHEVFLQQGPEGSGPPPHSHPWDEVFYVTQGEIAFGLGADQLVAVPGTMVQIPAGTPHWFRFGAGGGQMVSFTGKGNASAMFAHFDREIAPDAPDLGKLVAIAQAHGAKLEVPMPA
ncbi:cupin domain-containing protein [Ramlibacter albus]|uniref:Cupin domain-containing protein n=1 Tax=Ramlibacter albus TaxID=2079448 RepID=A0A923MCB9_9BURK|nr:cupin domain-containing protein [Ramlibacter albus]MBC5766442.1 cupin domain-containing protein [Ramlibacter albus]